LHNDATIMEGDNSAAGGGEGGGGASAEGSPSKAAAAPAEVVLLELTPEQLEDAKQVFSILAPDGMLLVGDLELAIGALGLFPSLEDLTVIRLEMGGAPALNLDAFVKAVSRKFPEDYSKELREAWSRIELEQKGEGSLGLAEFRHVLMSTEKMTDDEADALLQRSFLRTFALLLPRLFFMAFHRPRATPPPAQMLKRSTHRSPA
jgi:Ca2+-binding EF-hand superfamily protein